MGIYPRHDLIIYVRLQHFTCAKESNHICLSRHFTLIVNQSACIDFAYGMYSKREHFRLPLPSTPNPSTSLTFRWILDGDFAADPRLPQFVLPKGRKVLRFPNQPTNLSFTQICLVIYPEKWRACHKSHSSIKHKL